MKKRGGTYHLEYKEEDGIEYIPVSADGITDTSITVDFSPFNIGWNNPVDLRLFARDSAGNISPEYSLLRIYTSAEISSYTHEAGYRVNENNGVIHFIDWTVQGGAFHSWELKWWGPLQEDNGYAYSEKYLTLRSDNIKAADTKYNFFIFVNNDGGYRTRKIAVGEIALPNNLPELPSEDFYFPNSHAFSDFSFKWGGTFDPDGGEILYNFTAARLSDNLIFRLENLNDTTIPAEDIPVEFKQENENYEWHIELKDAQTGDIVIGPTLDYRIDNSEITINYPEWIYSTKYTNRDNMEIEITTGECGIKDVIYKIIYVDGSLGTEEKNAPQSTNGENLWLIEFPGTENPFDIELIVENNAGKIENVLVPSRFQRDLSLPEILGISHEDFYSTSPFIVSLNLRDEVAGIKAVQYAFTEDPLSAPDSYSTIILEENHSVLFNLDDSCTLAAEKEDGTGAYLVLRVMDHGGNFSSSYISLNPVIFDASPPVVSIQSGGFSNYGSQNYISRLEDVTGVDAVAMDFHSDAAEVLYSLVNDGGTPSDWYSDWNSVLSNFQGILENENVYRIAAKAANSAGLESVVYDVPFLFDNTPPVAVGIADFSFLPDTLVSGETIHLTLEASDPESPIVEYRVAIGTGSDPVAVSSIINGNSGGWLTGGVPDISFILPGVPQGSYEIRVEAVNAAGLVSVDSGNFYSKSIAQQDARILIRDRGGYQSDTGSLWFAWEYAGPEAITSYSYRLNGPGALMLWSGTTEKEILLENLELVSGADYYIEVYGELEAGGLTAIAQSRLIRIDDSYPMFNEPGGFIVPKSCHKDNFYISWDVAEPDSGIHKVEVLLERLNEENEKELIGTGWIELPAAKTGNLRLTTTNTGEKPDLPDGTIIYPTLRITNGAGLISEKGALPICFDNSPPPVPVVVNFSDLLNSDQAAEKGFGAHWGWSQEDPQSVSSEFYWTLMKDIPDSLESVVWYEDDGSNEVFLADINEFVFAPAPDEDTWYFIVKVLNEAGLEAIGYGSPITIDSEAPTISRVKLTRPQDESNEQYEEALYINDANNLYLAIEARDDIRVIQYHVIYGSFDHDNNWIQGSEEYMLEKPIISDPAFKPEVPLLIPVDAQDIDVPDFQENVKNYFYVNCYDSVGNESESGRSKGTLLDITPPEIIYLKGWCVNGELFFDWGGNSDVAPITDYQFELQKEAGQDYVSVYSGETVLSSINISENHVSLTDGTYRLKLKAKDAARNFSAEILSEPLIIDTLVPEVSLSLNTYGLNYVYDHLKFSITGKDSSGIAEYQYALGTADAPGSLTDGWVSGFPGSTTVYADPITKQEAEMACKIDLSETVGGLEGLQHEAALFLKVRVKDKTGKWSNVVSGEPVSFDKTAPDIQNIHVQGIYTQKDENVLYNAAFEVLDTQSLVAGYTAAVVQDLLPETLTSGDIIWREEVFSPLNNPFNISGLEINTGELTHGDSVYIVVRAINGNGHLSEPFYSGSIIIDWEPPVINAGDPGETLIFSQSPFAVPYQLFDEYSDSIRVQFSLESDQDHTLSNQVYLMDPPFDSFEVLKDNYDTPSRTPFQWFYDQENWGDYKLYVTLEDDQGNSTGKILVKNLYVNHRPVITFNHFETTPGKPLTLSAEIEDVDNENAGFTYDWTITPVSEVSAMRFLYKLQETDQIVSIGSETSALSEPEFRFLHYTDDSDSSVYNVSLVVTDSHGLDSDSEVTQITVSNTGSGPLYYNEMWQGNHNMSGEVTVPAEYTLSFASNTTVNVDHEEEGAGNYYSLVVLGDLEIAQGASFQLTENHTPYWGGIDIKGSALLKDLDLSGAFRGITICDGSDVILEDSVIDSNFIGLHVLKDGQMISRCVVSNNDYIGVKEEKSVTPQLVDCTLTGNYIDYYDKNSGRPKAAAAQSNN